MTRAERARVAARLRAEGLLVREVAVRMGVSVSYAGALLDDPDGAKVRARKDSYRGTCKSCGAKTDGSGGRNAPELCVMCTRGIHEERNARIFEAWERGEPTAVIAEREGMSPDAVLSLVDHYRREHGEALSLRRRRDRELWPLIEERWRAGATAAEIAAEAGTNAANVSRMVLVMRRAGIDLPCRGVGRPRAPEHVRRRAAALYAEGRSSREVADMLGVHYRSVLRWAREAGVPVRGPGRHKAAA